MDLIVDPDRLGMDNTTGMYVRARSAGKWGTYDICELTRESLLAWLASRDIPQCPSTDWRDAVILHLLGHSPPPAGISCHQPQP